jgi:AcrR family transcriptional regulator
MSTPYESSGRVRQKQRTRNELISAARSLMANGGSVTVEAAASAASISRTTAYRYFSTQNALLIAAHPEIQARTMLPPGIGDDPEERLVAAVRAFIELTVETEPQLRTMLRLSLESNPSPTELPLRKGRAIVWFEEVLAPLRGELSEDQVRRTAIAIRGVVGIESLVWLTDIAGLTRPEAAEQMLWSAIAVLRRALVDGPPGSGLS